MYVYKTTNLLNWKIYIGISKKKSLENQRYLGSGKAIKKAIKKYGRSVFKKEIIIESDEFTYADIQSLEIYFISKFESQNPKIGYNISRGGDGNEKESNGMYGRKHSKESIQKMIDSKREKKILNPEYGKKSEESVLKISEIISIRNKEKPTLPNGHKEDVKLKISKSMKRLSIEGKLHRNHAKFTEERKSQYSIMFSGDKNPFYGKKHSKETITKIKNKIRSKFPSVVKISFDGEIVKTYESITDVLIDGYRTDLVKKVLKGENKSHGGYFWKYEYKRI